MASKPKKRIHRPPPVDGMAACIVLQKGKWSRFQVGCHPVDAEAVSQLLSGCGPKCITDFVQHGPKKPKRRTKKRDDGDDFGGPIFVPYPVAPAAPVAPVAPPTAATPPAAPPAAPAAPAAPRAPVEILIPDPSGFGKSFRVTYHQPRPGGEKTARQLRNEIDEFLNSIHRDQQGKGPLTPEDKRSIQDRINSMAKAADQRPAPQPARPNASTFRDWDKQVTNPTGNVSGLSSRRPTMARRKACSVLRKQGKKLPARCKGTKRRRSR